MRKNIKPNIIKALLANSGNRCAFPGCNQPIVNEEYKIIAQLCHIEAASQNGPRYNKNQSDEERNGYDNPFEDPDWEMLHLGMPNLINIIKYRLIQIEILYYSEYLKLHNNDNLMRQQLEKSKTELMSVAGELMYYD